MNINCLESIAIDDSIDVITIDNPSTKFIKSYHIAVHPSNKYVILSVKCIHNIIYIYQIENEVKTLLHIYNIPTNKPIDYEYICANIKINPQWTKLSILEGNMLCLYDIHALLRGKIINEHIKLNDTNDLLEMHLYTDKVIRMYGNKNIQECKVKIIEILHTDSTKNMLIKLEDIPVKNIIISNNGYFMMYPRKKDGMNIYSLTDLTKFTLSCNINDDSRWLLSDDGDVIIRKVKHTMSAIMLDKKKGRVYTSNNLDIREYNNKTSIMLTTTKLGNIIMNTLLLWDKSDYTFYFWGIVNYNQEYIDMSDRMKIKHRNIDIPIKTSTNGRLFVNRYKNHTTVLDITDLIPFPCIVQCCNMLYRNIKEKITPTLSDTVFIGNLTTLKKQILTDKLIVILDPLVENDRIIMNTHDTLTVPIIEKSDDTCESYDIIHTQTDLDSVDLFFTILHNVSTSLRVFNSLYGDELYNVKVNMLFSLLSDILSSLLEDSPMSDSVKYCELCIICIILMYKYTNNVYDHNVVNKLKVLVSNSNIESY